MLPKTYLRILQGGIILSLLIILNVSKGLLFPFITSKQIPFNIVMEILFALWLVFILRYPEYRPKKNFIAYGLIAYFLAILASCFVSVDFNLSFWGDAERMLGFFHVAHFLVFYFILVTVFRSWKDWRMLFQSSVAVATLVTLIGLFGRNSYSTIGNTAYVSGYLIFNIYFIILLFFRSQSKGLRWFYILPLIPMLFEFWIMKTSGAIIGLSVSILLMFLLIGLSHVSKKIRRASLVVFIVAIIAIAGVFSQSKSAWFQHSFLTALTSQKITFQTRLISWRGAAEDFHNHVLFGTGFGNYAIIFDKYFDPNFYNYTTSDTYFDRAHNNLIDITSTTGLLGLVTYLSIFVALLFYLWREFKLNGKRTGPDANGLNNIEIIIVVSLIAAYFIQNLVIFDSFATYIGLMIILGFVYWLDFRRGQAEVTEKTPRYVIKGESVELICLIGFIIIAYIFANNYNVKTWNMFTDSIKGYTLISSGQLQEAIVIYKNSFTGRPMERDARTTLINLAISNASLFNDLSAQNAGDALDYIISLAKVNVAYNPKDSMMQMQLAQILDTAARYNYTNLEKFNFYSTQAMQAIEASIIASPGRATTYFVKAQMQLTRNESDEAIATMKEGIVLNTNYYEGYCRLSQIYFILDAPKYNSEIGGTLNNCIDLGGGAQISSPSLLKAAIGYYATSTKTATDSAGNITEDFKRLAILEERYATITTPNAEVWYNVAMLYYVIGNNDKAEESYQKAATLDPTYAKKWQEFKTGVDAGKKTEK